MKGIRDVMDRQKAKGEKIGLVLSIYFVSAVFIRMRVVVKTNRKKEDKISENSGMLDEVVFRTLFFHLQFIFIVIPPAFSLPVLFPRCSFIP